MAAAASAFVPFERSLSDQAWARWLARTIDTFLIIPMLVLVYVALGAAVTIDRLPEEFISWMDNELLASVVDTIILLVLFALWDPLFISNTGTTPGKWIMGVRVLRAEDGKRAGFFTALGRGLWVFAIGMGFFIPMVSLICMVQARSHLVRNGSMSWDKSLKLDVTHTKRHPAVWALVILAVIAANILVLGLAQLAA